MGSKKRAVDMKANLINANLPIKDKADLSPVQAKVPSTLYDEVNAQRTADGLTWHELTEGLFKAYLQARGAK